jgi:peptide/nickel transport system permease protein
MSLLAQAWRAVWSRDAARISLLVLAGIILIAVIGPAFLPNPAAQPDILGGASRPPAVEHPFGTDQLSRDVLSRVVSGSRVSLSVALLAVLVAMTIGAAVGLTAGYVGGRMDAVLMRFVDAGLAIPRLFILLLLLAVWERIPIPALILILGTTGWFGASRLVRGEVVRLRHEPFVSGAEALGAGRARVMIRHLLPNAAGPLLVAATLAVGDVILLEAGLSFLGLGIQPPAPEWGAMVADSRNYLVLAPQAVFFPTLAIVGLSIAFNFMGEGLRDILDPRMRRL